MPGAAMMDCSTIVAEIGVFVMTTEIPSFAIMASLRQQ